MNDTQQLFKRIRESMDNSPNKRIATTTTTPTPTTTTKTTKTTNSTFENECLNKINQLEQSVIKLTQHIQNLEKSLLQNNIIPNKNYQQQEVPVPTHQNNSTTTTTTTSTTTQTQPNQLIINEDNNNSEFANQLYNKINNEFNFYRINSQIKLYDSNSENSGKEINAIKIQEEFVKFIILKIMADDTDNSKPSKLIPSPILFEYWQKMALNNEKYKEFINLLGVNILYKLKDKLDLKNNKKEEEIKLKYNKTKELYEKYFSEKITNNKQDNSIWPINHILPSSSPTKSATTTGTTPQTPEVTTSNTTTPDHQQQTQPQTPNQPPPTQQIGESINIKTRDNNGQKNYFKIGKDTQMVKLMNAYSQKTGLNIYSFRFYFDGLVVTETMTANSLGLEDNDMIEVIFKQSGC